MACHSLKFNFINHGLCRSNPWQWHRLEGEVLTSSLESSTPHLGIHFCKGEVFQTLPKICHITRPAHNRLKHASWFDAPPLRDPRFSLTDLHSAHLFRYGLSCKIKLSSSSTQQDRPPNQLLLYHSILGLVLIFLCYASVACSFLTSRLRLTPVLHSLTFRRHPVEDCASTILQKAFTHFYTCKGFLFSRSRASRYPLGWQLGASVRSSN